MKNKYLTDHTPRINKSEENFDGEKIQWLRWAESNQTWKRFDDDNASADSAAGEEEIQFDLYCVALAQKKVNLKGDKLSRQTAVAS